MLSFGALRLLGTVSKVEYSDLYSGHLLLQSL